MLRTASLILLLAVAPAAAHDVGSSRTGHAAWHDCLREAYGLQAALSSRTVAADAAVRACRDRESAYLAALSTSPMLDDEDVSRVRPALVLRAKTWLMGRSTRPAAL